MTIYKNMVMLGAEGRAIEIWVEPWGDMYRLEADALIGIVVESGEEQDNARFDFNPAEGRITIWLQARAGRISFAKDGIVIKEWRAG